MLTRSKRKRPQAGATSLKMDKKIKRTHTQTEQAKKVSMPRDDEGNGPITGSRCWTLERQRRVQAALDLSIPVRPLVQLINGYAASMDATKILSGPVEAMSFDHQRRRLNWIDHNRLYEYGVETDDVKVRTRIAYLRDTSEMVPHPLNQDQFIVQSTSGIVWIVDRRHQSMVIEMGAEPPTSTAVFGGRELVATCDSEGRTTVYVSGQDDNAINPIYFTGTQTVKVNKRNETEATARLGSKIIWERIIYAMDVDRHNANRLYVVDKRGLWVISGRGMEPMSGSNYIVYHNLGMPPDLGPVEWDQQWCKVTSLTNGNVAIVYIDTMSAQSSLYLVDPRTKRWQKKGNWDWDNDEAKKGRRKDDKDQEDGLAPDSEQEDGFAPDSVQDVLLDPGEPCLYYRWWKQPGIWRQPLALDCLDTFHQKSDSESVMTQDMT